MDPLLSELTGLVKIMARTIDELREEIASLREAISSERSSSPRPTAAKAARRQPRARKQPTAPGLTKAEVEELLQRYREGYIRGEYDEELAKIRREKEELNKLIAEAARNAPVLEEYKWP